MVLNHIYKPFFMDSLNFLNENYSWFFYDKNQNVVKDITNASELVICYSKDENGNYAEHIMKTIKLPKKLELITIEWLSKKINHSTIYNSFTDIFKELLVKEYNLNINVYPTTYGIGVDTFNYNGYFDVIRVKVETLLNKHNIQFQTEYSEASLIYRFKISKSEKNIDNIKKIIDNEK